MKDKAKFVLEIPVVEVKNKINLNYDILGLKIENEEEVQYLKGLLPIIKKPLMIRAESGLLKKIINILDRECIIGIIDDKNYKEIVPLAVKNNHTVIIRTPIDINLAKEMNILTYEMGLEKILIDTDIGGIGYGFEYGYSIMEKIKLENDKFLNKPIISFAVEETLKTKEAKDKNLSLYLEICAASAVMACGADYIVLNTDSALDVMRRLL